MSYARLVSALMAVAVVGVQLMAATPTTGAAQATPVRGTQQLDLAQLLAGGKLKPVNREVSALKDRSGAVHMNEKEGNGVVWIAGTDFAQGSIELDVRGRDVMQRSFVGVAFHGRDDNTYEAVYLRPFNFRNPDVARRQNAVQYIALPDYDWARLRKEFPSEFENPVGDSMEPTGWVPLRIVVAAKSVQVYVGAVMSPTLEVRRLGSHDRGLIGLWTGNGSDGAFANLRLTSGE
jgi:hypothetical protein